MPICFGVARAAIQLLILFTTLLNVARCKTLFCCGCHRLCVCMLGQNNHSTLEIFASDARTSVVKHVGMPDDQRLLTLWRATSAAGAVGDMADLNKQVLCELLLRACSGASEVLGFCGAIGARALLPVNC